MIAPLIHNKEYYIVVNGTTNEILVKYQTGGYFKDGSGIIYFFNEVASFREA